LIRMRRIECAKRVLLVVFLMQVLGACSGMNTLFPDRSKEYKKARSTPALEVPPDLTGTPVSDALVVPDGETTLSGYTSARQTLDTSGATPVLPGQEGMTLGRDRDRTWLIVKGDPAAVWSKAREFWLESGFLLVREDPVIGILETDWVDSRAAIPQDFIRGAISRVFESAYSSAYRDRYRMRMERGETPGTTEIFITHQGVQERLQGAPDTVQTTTWEPRPNDPDLEAIMLREMMVYLGVAPEQAETLIAERTPSAPRADLLQEESGGPRLVVHEAFEAAWRSVGITLDRVEFAVEDRDRSSGIYYVRYNDPLEKPEKGFLSHLAFWSKDDEQQADTYQIKLSEDGVDTRVAVLNAAGEPEQSVTAVRILTLLYEDLR
jgi:outer membrane protein assembly factor BamC